MLYPSLRGILDKWPPDSYSDADKREKTCLDLSWLWQEHPETDSVTKRQPEKWNVKDSRLKSIRMSCHASHNSNILHLLPLDFILQSSSSSSSNFLSCVSTYLLLKLSLDNNWQECQNHLFSSSLFRSEANNRVILTQDSFFKMVSKVFEIVIIVIFVSSRLLIRLWKCHRETCVLEHVSRTDLVFFEILCCCCTVCPADSTGESMHPNEWYDPLVKSMTFQTRGLRGTTTRVFQTVLFKHLITDKPEYESGILLLKVMSVRTTFCVSSQISERILVVRDSSGRNDDGIFRWEEAFVASKRRNISFYCTDDTEQGRDSK